jgi:ParB/RepB/Spo0J family partition protein
MEKEEFLNEETYTLLPLNSVSTMPFNVRVDSGEAADTLTESIKAVGVLEPLVVRPSKVEAGKYELVCGFRRLKAAQKAGLQTVPCIIKQLSDAEAMEVALVENIEREDLSDYEVGRWFKLLMEKFPQEFRTQKAIADRFNLSESYVWRLIQHYEFLDKLNLPQGKLLSEGVVREIRRAPVQLAPKLVEHAVANECSVRDMAGIVEVLEKTPEDLHEKVMAVVVEKNLNARETAEVVKVLTAHEVVMEPEKARKPEKPAKPRKPTEEEKPKTEEPTKPVEPIKTEEPKKPSLEDVRAKADQIRAKSQQKLDRAGQLYVLFSHYYPLSLVDAFLERVPVEGLSEEKAVNMMVDVVSVMWDRLTKYGKDYDAIQEIFETALKWG